MDQVEHEVALAQPQVVASTVLRLRLPAAAARPTALLLAPAAGSRSDEPVLVALARGLTARGVAVGTFDFAYRRAGRRMPDRVDRLERAFRDVAAAFGSLAPTSRIVLGGRSMGGRIASRLAANGYGDGVLALAYPLWPQGQGPDPRRTAHWPAITVPVLFVHGDRDRLCPVDALESDRATYLRSAASQVHVVSGADHGFGVRARGMRSVADVHAEIVATIDRWLAVTFEQKDTDG